MCAKLRKEEKESTKEFMQGRLLVPEYSITLRCGTCQKVKRITRTNLSSRSFAEVSHVFSMYSKCRGDRKLCVNAGKECLHEVLEVKSV